MYLAMSTQVSSWFLGVPPGARPLRVVRCASDLWFWARCALRVAQWLVVTLRVVQWSVVASSSFSSASSGKEHLLLQEEDLLLPEEEDLLLLPEEEDARCAVGGPIRNSQESSTIARCALSCGG